MDRAIGVVVIMTMVFAVGWVGTNSVFQLPGTVIVAGCVSVVLFVGRISVVSVRRSCQWRAFRLKRLAERCDAKVAVVDLLDGELSRLSRWRERAGRFEHPILVERLSIEIATVDNLRSDVELMSVEDLSWALDTELDDPNSVPKARYGSELVVAFLAWLTGFPLSRETAIRTAHRRVDSRIVRRLDVINRAAAEAGYRG